MTGIKVWNANTSEYWAQVKLNAKIRKADRYIKKQRATMRSSMIYEQYVLDHLTILTRAAHQSGLINDADQYLALKEKWATEWGLPELTSDEVEIHTLADEATYTAAEALYGVRFAD